MNETREILGVILYCLEAAACIVGFVYWKKIKHSIWRFFPVYLLFISAAEQWCNYLNHIKDYATKGKVLGYLVIPAEFLFFLWIFYQSGVNRQQRRLVLGCVVFYLAAFTADAFYFSEKKFFFSSFSYSAGNLALLTAILSFFIRFVSSDQILHYKGNSLFWVSIGLLVFYLGTLPYFGFVRTLYLNYRNVYHWYTLLMYVCNCLMYCLFIASFIWGKPR